MASIIKWDAPTSPTTLLNTELDGLVSGAACAASSTFNNADASGRYLWGEAELSVALASSTSVAAPFLELYLVYSLDGSNWEDGGGAVLPPATAMVGLFPLRNTTAAQRVTLKRVPLSPLRYRAVLRNATGQTLAASGNVLRMTHYNEAAV